LSLVFRPRICQEEKKKKTKIWPISIPISLSSEEKKEEKGEVGSHSLTVVARKKKKERKIRLVHFSLHLRRRKKRTGREPGIDRKRGNGKEGNAQGKSHSLSPWRGDELIS